MTLIFFSPILAYRHLPPKIYVRITEKCKKMTYRVTVQDLRETHNCLGFPKQPTQGFSWCFSQLQESFFCDIWETPIVWGLTVTSLEDVVFRKNNVRNVVLSCFVYFRGSTIVDWISWFIVTLSQELGRLVSERLRFSVVEGCWVGTTRQRPHRIVSKVLGISAHMVETAGSPHTTLPPHAVLQTTNKK